MIAGVNKDELVGIDKQTSKKLGLVPGLFICWRVTTFIHLINPFNMTRIDLTSEKYFDIKDKIYGVCGRSQLRRYIVLDIERDFNNIIKINDDLMSDVNNKLKNPNQKGYL